MDTRPSEASKLSGNAFEPIDIYKIALETRNFEIEFFWQRCNYFLVLNSALVVGFFKLREEPFSLLLSITGFIVCVLWFRVALGAKYWQSRWEYSILELEKQFIGNGFLSEKIPLFSADSEQVREYVKKSQEFWNGKSKMTGFSSWIDRLVLTKPSVSKTMMILVLVFCAMWACAVVYQLFQLVGYPFSA